MLYSTSIKISIYFKQFHVRNINLKYKSLYPKFALKSIILITNNIMKMNVLKDDILFLREYITIVYEFLFQ